MPRGQVYQAKSVLHEPAANAVGTQKRSSVPIAGHSSDRDTQHDVSRVADTVELAVKIVGSPAALARVLAITQSHASRLRKGTAGISATLSLRLSRVIGRPLLQGLRDDGHVVFADLMQPLATAQEDKRFAAERAIVDDLSCLPAADFDGLRRLIASLVRAARREKKPSSSVPSGGRTAEDS
jgi:DNA-binding transcriptional regulator YdaS (Cro superfamily)